MKCKPTAAAGSNPSPHALNTRLESPHASPAKWFQVFAVVFAREYKSYKSPFSSLPRAFPSHRTAPLLPFGAILSRIPSRKSELTRVSAAFHPLCTCPLPPDPAESVDRVDSDGNSKISGAGAGDYNIPAQNRAAGKTLNPASKASSKMRYGRYFLIAVISLRGDINNAYQRELSPHINE